MRKSALLRPDEAGPVADVLHTVTQLREASAAAVKLAGRPDSGLAADRMTRVRAAAWIAELTGRIHSRARSAGLSGDELLHLANDVLAGRRALPEGFAPMEAA